MYPREQLEQDITNAIIDRRLLYTTKKGEHLFPGVRGSNPQAAIRKDVLDKNIAYFWLNVKWESEKNSNQDTEMPSAFRIALEKAGYIDQNGHIKYMQEGGEQVQEKKGKTSYSLASDADNYFEAAVDRAIASEDVDHDGDTSEKTTGDPTKRAKKPQDKRIAQKNKQIETQRRKHFIL